MSTSADIQHALDQVIRLHANRLDLLRADPRPKVGFVSIQTPEEILLAAGAVPFRLTGEHGDSSTEAGARLGSNYCSYLLSCLAEGLEDVYSFVDGMVFVDACDMRKRLWEAWGREVASHWTSFIELPSDDGQLAREYFATVLQRWRVELEDRYGRRVTDDDLREAISLCNTTRSLLQRLHALKKRPRPPIDGLQSLRVVQAASTGFKSEYNFRLAELVDLLEAAEPASARFGPRVLLCGSYFDREEIIRIIEGTGAELVCEDISNGVKYFEGKVSLEGDPIQSLADHYLETHTSARLLDTDVRLSHMLDLVDEYRVDSVIYYVLKFCDTNLHDYPYIKQKLRASRIPVLFIEDERNAQNIASTKTRIQTFLEPHF